MTGSATSEPARWYAWATNELADRFETDLQTGLSQPVARRRLADQGPNELQQADAISRWRIVLDQFSSLIIWVLIAAAVISGLLEEWIDTGAILAIVLLNAILGFVQEYRAEQSLAALQKLSITYARVIRDKARHAIPSRDLVPGDLIEVEAGDHVPADARLLYAAGLRTLEATLTGESTPVDKAGLVLTDDADVAIADQRNMVFLGTTAVSGKGRAVVVATGSRTQLGRIATLMTAASHEPTPLQRRLEQLGHVLLYASLAIVTLVFGLGVLRGEPLVGMFLTAVSLAVAAIPEGLPAIVTMTLALGVTRMASRNALIRRLPAVETLGSATVICTDKTGTLTKNEMTVTRLFAGGEFCEVTGEGYSPTGAVTGASAAGAAVRDLLTAAVLCNGAALCKTDDGWSIVGDPTEGALLVAAAKIGLDKDSLEKVSMFVGEIPFDPERKMMTVVRQEEGGIVAYTKGAPDLLLLRCNSYEDSQGIVRPLADSEGLAVARANESFARNALRVIGVARRRLEDLPGDRSSNLVECRLTFIGLAAMKDPLRPEAKTAVARCRQAGIRTVMITGDHQDTALAIARDATIIDEAGQVLTGLELDRLTDADLAERVEDIGLYARVSAEHKLRIVRAWRARQAIVAMTGDGVNDAPAVKEADIGIAMGLAGTDVTKAASDMVVTDDNFASIAAAVEEGRGIYDNIRKAVHYLLSCNLSEVLVMFGTTLAGLPLPLLPAQILWINLVTDGLPALALAADPYAPDLMRRPPRHPSARMFGAAGMWMIFRQGSLLALVATAAFLFGLYGLDLDVERARTLTFCTLVLAQLFHSFTCRSERYSLFRIGVWTNPALIGAVGFSALVQIVIVMSPWGQDMFRVTPLSAQEWLLTLGLGLLPWLAIEASKALRNHDGNSASRNV